MRFELTWGTSLHESIVELSKIIAKHKGEIEGLGPLHDILSFAKYGVEYINTPGINQEDINSRLEEDKSSPEFNENDAVKYFEEKKTRFTTELENLNKLDTKINDFIKEFNNKLECCDDSPDTSDINNAVKNASEEIRKLVEKIYVNIITENGINWLFSERKRLLTDANDRLDYYFNTLDENSLCLHGKTLKFSGKLNKYDVEFIRVKIANEKRQGEIEDRIDNLKQDISKIERDQCFVSIRRGYHDENGVLIVAKDKHIPYRVGSFVFINQSDRIYNLAKHLSGCVAELHNKKIVHGYLNDDCFFREGKSLDIKEDRIKLDLFTGARLLGSYQDIDSIYIAPELKSGGQAIFASDVYSLGIILYETIIGGCIRRNQVDFDLNTSLNRGLHSCFTNISMHLKTDQTINKNVIKENNELNKEFLRSINNSDKFMPDVKQHIYNLLRKMYVYKLIQRCCDANPSNRPTAAGVVQTIEDAILNRGNEELLMQLRSKCRV